MAAPDGLRGEAPTSTDRLAWYGRRRVFYLHQEVVGATHGDGFVVEHVNGRKRDSRRENLRVRSVPAPTMRRD